MHFGKVTSITKCSKAVQTANAVLAQLIRSFHYQDIHGLVSLWLAKDIEVVEKVQTKVVNLMSGLTGTRYEEKLDELEMLNLKETRHQTDMVQVYKTLHGHDNVDRGKWFKLAGEREVNTRLVTGVLNLFKPRCNTDM